MFIIERKLIYVVLLMCFVSFFSICHAQGARYMGENGGFYRTNVPGTKDAILSLYYYETTYIIDGIVHSDREDLCETGVLEKYYYLQTEEPLVFYPRKGDLESEKRSGVTKIQLPIHESTLLHKYLGKFVRIYGKVSFRVAGCHIHTDVYFTEAQLML